MCMAEYGGEGDLLRQAAGVPEPHLLMPHQQTLITVMMKMIFAYDDDDDDICLCPIPST